MSDKKPLFATYKVEEIFPNWEKEDEDVEMKLPDEVIKELGLKPGDKLKIDVDEKTQSMSIEKITENVDNSEE